MRSRHTRSVKFAPGRFRQRRANALAWRHEIRLEPAVASRSAARKKAHTIRMWPVAVRRSYGYHPVGVSRVGNAKGRVAFIGPFVCLETLVTAIARSGNHHNSIIDKALAFVAYGSAAASKVTY